MDVKRYCTKSYCKKINALAIGDALTPLNTHIKEWVFEYSDGTIELITIRPSNIVTIL